MPNDARRIGLVNRVVAPDELEKRNHGARGQDRLQAARTLKTGKEAFYRQLEMPLGEAYDYATRVMTENMLDSEACEGIGAFLEKRTPKWPT